MNPLLAKLQPYPFERLRQLFAGVVPNADYRPISLGIGEPKHPTPVFIRDALAGGLDALAAVREVGGDAKAVLTVVDREEGATEALAAAGVELIALFTKSDFGA